MPFYVQKDGLGSFDGFGSSGEQVALLLIILQNTVPRGNHDGFDGFGGVAVSVVTATPRKLNPSFPTLSGPSSYPGQKRAHKLKKNSRDTSRVSLGNLAGQTGVYRPVSQGFPGF